ncbi:MAG TPA: heparan-alpha-glucosaminide N-acetyltransferase domain-containing protein [Chryseosolibacter sp.]
MATAAIAPDLVTEKQRINSIDIMRGLVMVIMALDHARDFFYVGGYATDPTNLAATTPALFFTRWITHYCAPTFVFLAGTSIFLNLQKKNKKDLSVFLLTRGLWLIVLELVVVRFAIVFNFYYDVIFFQVIWVIGASMVCMAGLIHLHYKTVLALGFIIVFGHNIFDAFRLQAGDSFFAVWTVLRQSGLVPLTDTNALFVIYPLFPWLGIMILGFGLGKLYSGEFKKEERRKLLFILGFSAIALFIVLRFINIYGDPAPWSAQKDGVFTFMSFINTTKYPVSLLYTLMTLGPVLVVLALMEGINFSILKPFHVFGRVPMFYYVLHFSLIHAISLALFMNKTGKSLKEIDFHFSQSFGGITTEGGYSLTITYLLWMAVVLFLYPLCVWYNRYKSTHKHWWLSYI